MNDKWVLYLITKEKYYEKPLYAIIFKTLQNTKLFCIKNNITTLALPKISCGLDKKDWNIISTMIKFTFRNSNIKIQIFCLPQDQDIKKPSVSPIKNDIENINEELKNKILQTAASFIKTEVTPKENDSGAHSLSICLQNLGFNISTLDILQIINISNHKSGYNFSNNDMAYICDQFKLNLYIIFENEIESKEINTTANIYWKSNRPSIGVFNKNNLWTPGNICRLNIPRVINKITINTIFPKFETIKKHIDRYLYERLDQLNLSEQNPIKSILNNKRKQRVLSIEVEFQKNKQYAIIDTGSNISCVNFELIKNNIN